MSILLAPIYSLFSLAFYRRVARTGLSAGFGYLAYLSALTTLIFFIGFQMRVMPAIDDFQNWVKAQMPPMTWSPEGFTMDRPSPYVMFHPEFGPLAVFDMQKENVTLEDLDQAAVFVTARRLYARRGKDRLAVYEWEQLMRQSGMDTNTSFRFTGENLDQIYNAYKPWMMFVVPFFFFLFFFLWKLLLAFVFSLLALLVNAMRRDRYAYPALLNVTIFAMTAATLVEILRLTVPALAAVPYGFLGSVILTAVYLYFGIKVAEQPSGAQGPAV